MNQSLRRDAEAAVRAAIRAVLPEEAVRRALSGLSFPGRVILIAAGKAAPRMAKAALEAIPVPVTDGAAVSKYGHFTEDLAPLRCFEAGHPVPDENSEAAAEAILALTADLTETDTVLFLLSGGGSALFEKPLIPLEELRDVTDQLLGCGADIGQINTIRKRLSAVKGGRFAQICWPARVEAVILSDILGDPLDMIASGPACPDSTTTEDAQRIAKKYELRMSDAARALLAIETPKVLNNVRSQINGSVRELCAAAAKTCIDLGYTPVLLTDQLCCQAKEAGSFLASILKTHQPDGRALAFIAGGETVVKLIGKGLGGRNQELALAAAAGIADMPNAAVFSVGSDGTDGPTDAAGGYCDGDTVKELALHGLTVDAVLGNNDAYHALQKTGGLIMTGPTGTNVNDVAVALLRF